MKSFIEWLDKRTGIIGLLEKIFCQHIPGGAKWRYAWGGVVVFAIAIQFITGLALWMCYSSGVQNAWESVNHIQNEMAGGWLLRGLHHYTAQVLPVLVALHIMQLVIDKAYRAPREVNFWFALICAQVVLLMALTGYQLPWDQKGFWATKVAMNILGIVPVIGKPLQTVLIGGPDYGQLTLTRFLGVHAGLLPFTLLVMSGIYFYLSRRNGFAGVEGKNSKSAPYWPDQLLRNAVVCLALVGTLLFLILHNRIGNPNGQLGAELTAPADPSEAYSAARPEWYFLFLYQFLKLFPARMEIVGAIVIPGMVAGVFFLMPFIGRSKAGQRFNIGFIGCLFVGIGLLTNAALSHDANDPEYKRAVALARVESARVRELAASPAGIPPTGALTILRNDPLTQGPKLFSKYCSSCHRYEGGNGLGDAVKDTQSASELSGFASRAWLAGLLDPAKVGGTNYFGGTQFANGKMVKFVKKHVSQYSEEEKARLQKIIAAVSAEAGLRSQAGLDAKESADILQGREFFHTSLKCAECHQLREKDETAEAPDLTGYGSRDWMVRFISNPGHASFYGDRNDRMPAFAEKEILNEQSIGLIVDWLRGDWYRPEDNKNITALSP